MVVVYVGDIIFSGNKNMCKIFFEEMQKEFEMSMFGEMNFFLGFQINQMDKGIFHFSIKICKGNVKELWNGKFKISM